jgi:hypothetical protein
MAALWFWAGFQAVPTRAQDQAPDLPTYTGWLREAFAAAQRSDRIGLDEAAGRLTTTTAVRLPGGTQVSVDNGWLRQALVDPDPDFQVIARRLGAVIDALAQPASTAPADARQRLDQILSSPPFERDPLPNPNWLADFFDWLGRLLDSLLRPLGSAPSGINTTIGWAVGIIGALLLVGVVVYLLLGLRRAVVAPAQVADDPEANLTAREALDQAGDVARGGDFRAAMRLLYLSALLWLDERGKLRYDRALTNREYLDRVADNPSLRARLAPVVETFDRVWYGHTSLDAETFAAYRRQVEELRKQSEEP